MGTKDTEKKDDSDQLRQNYQKLDENGRENLKKISDQLLNIYNIVLNRNKRNIKWQLET
jgi:hypothetical protein